MSLAGEGTLWWTEPRYTWGEKMTNTSFSTDEMARRGENNTTVREEGAVPPGPSALTGLILGRPVIPLTRIDSNRGHSHQGSRRDSPQAPSRAQKQLQSRSTSAASDQSPKRHRETNANIVPLPFTINDDSEPELVVGDEEEEDDVEAQPSLAQKWTKIRPDRPAKDPSHEEQFTGPALKQREQKWHEAKNRRLAEQASDPAYSVELNKRLLKSEEETTSLVEEYRNLPTEAVAYIVFERAASIKKVTQK
jgi:hypothetical protein